MAIIFTVFGELALVIYKSNKQQLYSGFFALAGGKNRAWQLRYMLFIEASRIQAYT